MRATGWKWKSALVVGAGLMALAGRVPSAGAASCGDLNNDGKLTIADAVKLQRAIVAPNPADCGGSGSASCGDVNPQAPGLEVGDTVALLAHLAGNPTLFALCQGQGSPIACTGGAGSGPGGESWTGQATVTGSITQSQTWPAGCRVNINGLTFVQPGVTVTMEPGVLVVGQDPPSQNGGPTNVSALVFLRGSRINAASDATHSPILMTSSDHVDANNGHIGDWGGLTLNGAGPVNCPGNECLAEGLVGVPFGGTNPNDSSGVMEYVRVEFSGRELSPDNELNIITLNGLGGNTVYDHVQANVGFDDCQEWFGGNPKVKYLVSSGCGDDMFDQQLGTSYDFQYGLAMFNNGFMQNAGNECFEWDNNENGFDLLPRSNPRACNVTCIGSALQTGIHDAGLGASEGGILARRGTAGTIANTILEHFRIYGLSFRDDATAAVACDDHTHLSTTNPALVLESDLFFDNGAAGDGATPGDHDQVESKSLTGAAHCTGAEFWGLSAASRHIDPANHLDTTGTDPQIPVIYGTGAAGAQTSLDQFVPAGAGGTASEPKVNNLAMHCSSLDPTFFEDHTPEYLGAFSPGVSGSNNWLSTSGPTPWISFRLN